MEKLEEQRGSAKAIAEIIKLGNRISIKEMANITEAAVVAGGSLVSVEPDDDWCGNGRLHFKWPPKRNEFMDFLNLLAEYRINYEVLINGVPPEKAIVVQVSRDLNRLNLNRY